MIASRSGAVCKNDNGTVGAREEMPVDKAAIRERIVGVIQ